MGRREFITLLAVCRRGDVVRMGWQHIQGDCIAVRQEKTNTPLLIPIDEPLAAVLAVLPRTNMTFLVTEFGKPFAAPGFGATGLANVATRPDFRNARRMPDAAIKRSRRSLDIDRIRRWPLTSAPPIKRVSRVLRWSEERGQNGMNSYPTSIAARVELRRSFADAHVAEHAERLEVEADR